MVLKAGEMVEADVPPAAVVGVVARENIHEGRNGDIEDVAGAARVELDIAAIGPDPDHTSAAELQFSSVAALGFHEAEITHRDINPAINAHLDGICRVVGGAAFEVEGESFHEHFLLVGDTVAVLVDERTEMRRMHADDRVPLHNKTAGRVDFCELFDLIRTPVIVGIPEAQNAAPICVAAERTVAVAADEKRAIRRGRDEYRVVRLRRCREERGFEAIGDFHILE